MPLKGPFCQAGELVPCLASLLALPWLCLVLEDQHHNRRKEWMTKEQPEAQIRAWGPEKRGPGQENHVWVQKEVACLGPCFP